MFNVFAYEQQVRRQSESHREQEQQNKTYSHTSSDQSKPQSLIVLERLSKLVRNYQ